jgi:hypothetical protein
MWPMIAAAGISAAGSVAQGALNKKNGVATQQQVLMTPEQKRMLRRMTGITDMVLAGGQTPADIAAANAAQTEGQLALRDAVVQQEQMPGSSAMTPEMLAMLQAKSLQGRVAGNVAVRNASYDAARQAGLQLALNSKASGTTQTKTAVGDGAMADALGGVAQGVGMLIPTTPPEAPASVQPTTVQPGQLPGGATTPDFANDPRFKLKYGG